MTVYIDIPIQTDPDSIVQDAFDYMESVNENWTPDDGQLDVWILLAIARMAATLRDTASQMPVSLFRYLGAQLHGVLPIDDSPATSTITVVAVDTNGPYTAPAGAAFGISKGGELIAFETTVDILIPFGSTTMAGIAIRAMEPNADASSNNLGTPGDAIQPLDQFGWIDSATLDATTGGGVDAEEDSTYLNRLVGELQLMAPRPILPRDFAVMSQNVTGVWRALVLDGYNTADSTSGNERMVSVFPVQADGTNLTSLTDLQDYLQSLRELNFVVNVANPTRTTVDVHFAVTAYPGWDTTDVHDRIVAAVTDFLSSATWGQTPTGDGRDWLQRSVVKNYDLVVVIGRVQGVQEVNTVTARTGAGAFAVTDVALAGAAPLAGPGADISGTVS